MKKFFLFLYICIFACLVTGCTSVFSTAGTSNEKIKQQFFALNTVIEITAYGENAQKGITAAKEEITRLENLLSVTIPESDVAKINGDPQATHTVSQDTAAILEQALDVAEKSGGMLDVSVYPITKLWGFTTGEYTVPDAAAIKNALAKVNYKNIRFDKAARTVTLAFDMQLDLGAVAKGYIAQQAAQAMKQSNVQSAVLNLGGNVQTVGERPDENESLWRVGVEYPDTKNYFCKVGVEETAIVTSGAYQRNFERDGVLYHHIMNPKTGYPADSTITSATVVAQNGTLADALSTALFILDAEQAITYYKTYGGFDFVLLTKTNQVYVTAGIYDQFTLANGYENLSVHKISR